MSYWKPISLAAVVVGVIVMGALAQSQPQQGQPTGPWMMMNHGMMGQGMMMGPGMGHCGMMGTAGNAASSPLTVDQVTQNMTQWLAWQGNPCLKLGTVAEQKDGTITADITTQDGSLVQKLVVDRANGWMRQAP
ncbi:MAG: hypothetical protein HY055_09930 [Magnetospirillum sp.]|nr:hypothetical protein [Paramagnetospirillum magnetotacticum]MBI3445660.1 hypothetical protein [Magnetospirillum sp.]